MHKLGNYTYNDQEYKNQEKHDRYEKSNSIQQNFHLINKYPLIKD